jgi:crotonobetainyl-CoA:carnitine CoA-transferase CaiB-like acyl-CoA transferase
MERLGVGYFVLSRENPALVYCAITGYGQSGPYRDRAGHDINYIGYTGVLHATGAPDGPPILPSVQVGDFGGGMAAAVGILAALNEVGRTGSGRFVDVSMMDVVASWTAVLSSWYLATGSVPERGRMPLSGGLACYRVYRAGDGKYLAVGALEPQFWRALCERIGLEGLIDLHLDPGEQGSLAAKLSEVFATRPRDEWVAEFADLDACVGPVNDVAEALTDSQAAHRGLLADIKGKPVGPGPAIKLPSDPPGELRPAPGLGEHTDEVLEGAGLTSDEVVALRKAGVL